jgi:glyceraldehyde 3-phosphate dehydrogenase
MTIRVGINGFGRIGRSFERVLLDREPDAGLSVSAVNEPHADADTLAFQLQHDSVGADVEATGTGLRAGGHDFALRNCSEPADIPWAHWGLDLVIEAIGQRCRSFRCRPEPSEPRAAMPADPDPPLEDSHDGAPSGPRS